MDCIDKKSGKILLEPIEYLKRRKVECGNFKQKALANTQNAKMFIYYCRMWNNALADFKQRFEVKFPD